MKVYFRVLWCLLALVVASCGRQRQDDDMFKDIDVKSINSETIVNRQVEYYRQNNDWRHLAQALYIKGMWLHHHHNDKEAIICLKQAESMAVPLTYKSSSTEAYQLMLHIYLGISSINMQAGIFDKASSYARKAQLIAEKTQSPKDKGMVFDNLTQLSIRQHQPDSALYYAEKCIPCLPHLDKHQQASTSEHISMAYANRKMYALAQQYASQAVKEAQCPDAHIVLGKIAAMQHQDNVAMHHWQQALKHGDEWCRLAVFKELRTRMVATGQQASAIACGDSIIMLAERIIKTRQTEQLMQEQNDFEQNEIAARDRQLLYVIVGVAAPLLIIFFIMMAYSKRKERMKEKQLKSQEQLVINYSRQIDDMEKAYKNNCQENSRLKSELQVIRKKRSELIHMGEQRFKEIRQGGTVAAWGKDDFDAFVEYYRSIEGEKVAVMENTYDKLTSYNMFFLILFQIGINEADMPRILNRAAGTVRTLKSRMKGLKKEATQV